MGKVVSKIRTSQDVQDWDPGISFDVKSEEGASRTIQSQKEECDINNIIRKHVDLGVRFELPPESAYLDVSEIGDYQDALNRVIAAEELFMSLPWDVRAKFDNDPGKLVEYCQDIDDDKLLELGKLGLAKEDAVNAVRIKREKAAQGQNSPPVQPDPAIAPVKAGA